MTVHCTKRVEVSFFICSTANVYEQSTPVNKMFIKVKCKNFLVKNTSNKCNLKKVIYNMFDSFGAYTTNGLCEI